MGKTGEKTSRKRPLWKRPLMIPVYFLAVLVIVLVTVLVNLDNIAASGIRSFGSEIMGTEVNVRSVDTALLDGSVQIREFTVANPEGFKAKHAISVKNFVTDVDIWTVTSQDIVVEYLEISGMTIDLEYQFQKGLNLNVLIDNAKKASGKAPKQTPDGKAPEQKSAGKKVTIRKIVLKDIKFTFSSKTLNTSIPLSLPDLTLENIGTAQDPADITVMVLEKLLDNVWVVLIENNYSIQLKELGQDIANQAVDAVKKNGKVLKEEISTLIDKNVNEGKKELKSALEKGKEDLRDSLKDLVPANKRKNK